MLRRATENAVAGLYLDHTDRNELFDVL